MKKFKTFHCGIDPADEHAIPKTAVEWANEWIEENPDADILVWSHALDPDGHDVICISYEEGQKADQTGEDVYMRRYYDPFANRTLYACPKCAHERYTEGNVTLYDERCPKCARKNRVVRGATADPLTRE